MYEYFFSPVIKGYFQTLSLSIAIKETEVTLPYPTFVQPMYISQTVVYGSILCADDNTACLTTFRWQCDIERV